MSKAKFERKKVEVVESGTFDMSSIVEDLKDEFKDEKIFAMDDEDSLADLDVHGWLPVPEPLEGILGGAGGIPHGLVTIFQGQSDSGKTTTALEELIINQQRGGIGVICLTEPKFSLLRARKMGLKNKNMIIFKAKTVEEAEAKLASIMGRISEAHGKEVPVLIVWDSIGYSKCKMEIENKSHNNMWKASALKTMLGTMQIWLDDTHATLIGINHTYKTMDGRNKGGGGEGVKFAGAMIFDFANIGKIMKEDSYYVAIKDIEIQEIGGELVPYKKGEVVPKEYCLGDKELGIPSIKPADRKLMLEMRKDKRGVGSKSIIKNVKNHVGTPFLQTEVKIDQYGLVYGRKLDERKI
jgi:RecA/RadA recombinase